MIENKVKPVEYSNTAIDSFTAGVSSNKGAKLIQILQEMYSDPTLAVIREYLTNAFDAHIEAGVRTTPVKVTLPTAILPYFIVRDFGKGITPEFAKNIYFNYLESTKENSNEYTGMLGLGSKSAFAYTSVFNVISFHQGKKYVWTAFKNAQIAPLPLVESTLEPDGLEIRVPVALEHITEFYEKTKEVCKYFEVLPDIEGQEIELETPKTLYNIKGDNWRFTSNTHPVAIMGNIGYPIDTQQFPKYENILTSGLEIKVKIGELEIAPSRESLKYTKNPFPEEKYMWETDEDFITRKSLWIPGTVEVLTRYFEQVTKEFLIPIQNQLDTNNTLMSAFKKLHDICDKFITLKDYIKANVTFNGEKIPQCFKHNLDSTVVKVREYHKNIRKNNISISYDPSIWDVEDSTCTLIINDTDDSDYVIKRRVKGIFDSSNITDVLILNIFDYSAFRTAGFSTQDFKFLSSIPLPPKNTNSGTRNSNNLVNKTKDKVFRFIGDGVTSYSYASEYWTAYEIDLATEPVIYVVLDRFVPLGYYDKYKFNNAVNTALSHKLKIPKIIGIRHSEICKLNKKSVLFVDFIAKEYEKRIASLNVSNVFTKAAIFNYLESTYANAGHFYSYILEANNVNKNSSIYKLAQIYATSKETPKDNKLKNKFYKLRKLSGSAVKTYTTPVWIEELVKNLHKDYPILSNKNIYMNETYIKYIQDMDELRELKSKINN